MSGNRHPLPPFEPGTFRAADGTIRRFSDYHPRPYDRPTDSASGSLYTVIRQFHDDLDRLDRHLLVATNDTVSGTSRMASNSDRWRQRFINDAQSPNPSDALSNPPPLPPLRSLGTRARPPVTPSDPPTSRSSRYRPANRRPYIDNTEINTSLDELNRNIDDTNTHLRALLNYTGYSSSMPRPLPAVSFAPHGQEAAEEGRRAKRRKLDSDKIAPSFKGFRYGKYGQVEAGQLTMEIVSCDGGLYSDEHLYAPENILRDDNSVYCTKGNRCNIVLKHQGGTVFTLSELVVKAPGSRFSCPVREGMVFVATESDELLTRTAQYQIQYTPGRSTQRARGTVIFRHDDDGTGVNRWQTRYLRAYSYGADDDEHDDIDFDDDIGDEHDDDEDCRTAQIPPEFTVTSGRFNTTTEMSENDSDDENIMAGRDRIRRQQQQQQQQQQQGRQTPNRIGLLAFESGSSDDDDDGGGRRRGGGVDDDDNDEVSVTLYPPSRRADSLAAAAAIISTRRQRQREHRRSAIANANARMRDELARASTSSTTNTNTHPTTTSTTTTTGTGAMTLEQAQEASQIATQEAVRAVGGELMAPLAHFFIEKDKNKCTIRFDPPVSARYLLLKMWSPHHDLHDGGPKNIDIQGVTVKGFAGPRFCAAVDVA